MARQGGVAGWPLAAAALAWLAGVAWQLQQPTLGAAGRAAWGGALGALLGLAGVWCLRRTPPGAGVGRARAAAAWLIPGVLIAGGAALLGFHTTEARALARMDERLDPALEGQDLVLVGTVAALPQVGSQGTRFRFDVESAELPGRAQPAPLKVPQQVPATVSLGWSSMGGDELALAEPPPPLRPGDRWRLPVRLKQPHGVLNPQGFDAELWLWEQGLRATGQVRQAVRGVPPQRLGEGAAHPVERLRQVLRHRLYREVSEPRAAGVLAALVVGDQAAIEREDWDLFRDTGIAHLVSISGLHVTMFAWIAGLVIGAAWRLGTRLMLWMPAGHAGRWGGLAVATGYALLAGWGVPAERTLLMLALGVVLRSAGMRWPLGLVLLAAAVAVTLRDPWALMQAGFWLSFAAVALLLASDAAVPASTPAAASGWRGAALGLLRSQAVATLGLAPLSLVFFQQVSVVGYLANLVAIPLVTLLITPLALLGVLVAPLWWLAARLVDALCAGLAWLAAWPWAVWTVPAAPAWAVACGLAGAALGVMPLPWRVRWLALPLVLPLLFPAVPRPAPGSFELLAADVGQGTAVLVRTHAHLLLYDAGPAFSADQDAGQRLLVPLLRSRGERAIDLLMLSHRDSDHVGGAGSVMRAVPVRALSSSLEEGHPLRRAPGPGGVGIAHTPCIAGQSWQWDGVRFEVLHPTAADLAAPRKPNAVSCVLRIADARGRSALLAGDIESPEEAALLRRRGAAADAPLPLHSDVLLVPHHGSRSSSTEALLDAVVPSVAVVQAGYRNRFGHPVREVMARYTARGIAIVRTDHCGAWLWHDGASWCTRDVHRRYWHWRAPPAQPGADVADPSAGEGTP